MYANLLFFRLMFFSADPDEMERQVSQILEMGGSSKEQMLHGICKLGGLWASARLRFKDLPGSELSAAWAKIVSAACEGQIAYHTSWLQDLKRSSAGTGEIMVAEEHLELLKQVQSEKWLDIDLQL